MLDRSPLGARLINRAEDFYDLPPGVLKHEKRRNGDISKARWAVWHVLTTMAGYTDPRAGDLMGKDHKAVAYGKKQAAVLLRHDELFFECVRLLKEEVAPDGNPHI
jgi:hypothetical protein